MACAVTRSQPNWTFVEDYGQTFQKAHPLPASECPPHAAHQKSFNAPWHWLYKSPVQHHPPKCHPYVWECHLSVCSWIDVSSKWLKENDPVFLPLSSPQRPHWFSEMPLGITVLLEKEIAQNVSDGWNKVCLPLLSLAHQGAKTSMPKAAFY